MSRPSGSLSLKECAERLGVHYMTVYRYVRTGVLPAAKHGAEWRVDEAECNAFKSTPMMWAPRSGAHWSERLDARMRAGDERGAWLVLESALGSGFTPERIYLEVLGPALRELGEAWHRGTATVGEEHRASAVAHRLIGRMGARFATRGRPRGRVLLGTPPGERHALAVAMLANMMRNAGFEAVDLGADAPIESYVEAALEMAPLAVGISVTTPAAIHGAARVVAAVHAETVIPVLLGGAAVRDEDHARELGADGYAADGAAAVAWVSRLAGERR